MVLILSDLSCFSIAGDHPQFCYEGVAAADPAHGGAAGVFAGDYRIGDLEQSRLLQDALPDRCNSFASELRELMGDQETH